MKYSTFSDEFLKEQPDAVYALYKMKIEEQRKIIYSIDLIDKIEVQLDAVDIMKYFIERDDFMSFINNELSNKVSIYDSPIEQKMKLTEIIQTGNNYFPTNSETFKGRFLKYLSKNQTYPVLYKIHTISALYEENKKLVDSFNSANNEQTEISEEFNEIRKQFPELYKKYNLNPSNCDGVEF